MIVRLKTQYHVPYFYSVPLSEEIVKTTIEYNYIDEALEEFNRVVEMTELLMNTKSRLQYQPYDKIWLMVGNTMVKCWRKEDVE